MLMIGAALVATGVGIAVAVQAVLVYNYFLRRLKLTAVDLDDFALDFYSVTQKHSLRVLLHPVLSKSGTTVAGQKVKDVSVSTHTSRFTRDVGVAYLDPTVCWHVMQYLTAQAS